MSDTPRTDEMYMPKGFLAQRIDQLERELAQAEEREAAMDRLHQTRMAEYADELAQANDRIVEQYRRDEKAIKQLQSELAQAKRAGGALAEALDRIMEYAHLGASMCDIDRNEQPQFIKAREALETWKGAQ